MASIDLEYNSGFQIYNSDGTPFHDLVLHKCTYETVVMSLGDKISGILYYKDNALDVTMSEYIIYKGVRYTLVNPPTILREGLVSDNSELRGMTKYSFTFYHPMYVLNNFPFSDIAVQSGESRYLSQNKTFSWIGTLVDFVAKLNKNLEDTQWMVTIGNVTQEEQTKLSEVLSFDKNTIAEALKRGYETWEVPYVVDQIPISSPDYPEKQFVVQYGLPTTEILDEYNQPFVFQMGQGVGLKNNSRNPKNNKIITRIAGYGSEDNIPYGYPQIPYYGGNVQYPLYYGIVGGQRVQLIKHPFTRNHLMPSVYSQSVYNKVNPKLPNGSNNPNYDPTIELVDYYDADDNTYPNQIKQDEPSYEIHEFGDIKPELGEKAIISAVPVSQQETQSDYKQKSDFLQEILDRISATEIEDEKTELLDVYDRVDRGLSYYKRHGEEGGDTYWYVFSITTDNYYEYVSYESSNYNFTATVLMDGSSAPTPDWDDTMDDDGNYLQSYFKITLPTLEFDLYACAAITQEMKINMRSGACIGCTFPVEVDWDDYKRNFYNSDGEFDPDGEQRDYTKYPDSSNGQITVMVKKELETFGTLMPNQYQQPTTGDKFVILGISLPETYITSAEQRLDTDMKQYMLDNNVYYFDYPLKFDEHFLINHEDILSQMKNNVVVRFNYAGTEHALYIKQMSVKYNESPLPKYDITLTDDIEIVLNQIGQVTDEVSKLRLGFGAGGFGTVGAEYIRKDIDDTARGTIRMIKGMQVGERFVTGLLGEGGVFRKDSDGTTYLETDKLYVRMKAYFDTVEVKHYLHTGGNRIASQASGIVCSRVEMIDAYNNLAMDVADAVLFRCFFKANDGDKTIRNDFMIGDLAFCHETNVDVSSVNLHGYWRLVIGRNADGLLTENKEAWIDLSNRASETLTIDGEQYVCNGYQNGSDAPIAQDDIIQLGNIANKDRQGAIVEYVGGENAPAYQIFQGIGEDLPYPYTLEDKNYIGLGYSSQTGHAYMNVYGDMFIGAKPDPVTGESPTYIKYEQEDSETGLPKMTIKAVVEFQSPDDPTQTTTLDDFANAVVGEINNIQSQIDGTIDTWFYDYMPVDLEAQDPTEPLLWVDENHTIPCLPYKDWYDADTAAGNNNERIKHLGDIFYDNKTGYAFRFSNTGTEANPNFAWVEITDSAVIKALENAAKAQDTADHKRRVFVTQPPSTSHPDGNYVEYDVGDLWVNATGTFTYVEDGQTKTVTYNNDLLRCTVSKPIRNASGVVIDGTFSITDWVLASKYTDDTVVEHYMDILAGGLSPTTLEKEAALAAERAIRAALGGKTIIDGGLMLTSILALRKLNHPEDDPDDPDNYTTYAGISGVYDTTLYGGGIAAWYGGGMVDKRNATTGEYDVANGAKSGFRFDGSGWLANGNITWDAQGRVAIKDITTLVGGNDTDILNALTTFNNAFHFTTAQGSSTILNINPQYAFSHLEIYDVNGNHAVATADWVGSNYVSIAFFNRLFQAYSSTTTTDANKVSPNEATAINNLKILVGAWTDQYLSAKGINPQQGGGGGVGDVTWDLLASSSDTHQIASSHLTTALSGYATKSWVSSNFNKYEHPTGGANTTITAADGKVLSSITVNNLGHVTAVGSKTLAATDIPSLSWNKITTDKPTTLSGYGITDAFTKTEVNGFKWWGVSLSNGVVTGNMTNVGSISMSSTISGCTSIDSLLYFDTTNSYIGLNTSSPVYELDVIGQLRFRQTSSQTASCVLGCFEDSRLPFVRFRDPDNNAFDIRLVNVGTNESPNYALEMGRYNKYTDIIGVNIRMYSKTSADTDSISLALRTIMGGRVAVGAADSTLTGGNTDCKLVVNGNACTAESNGSFMQIGLIRLVYDYNNNALKVIKKDGTTANFYATGAVSAFGSNTASGGGINLSDVFEAYRTSNSSNEQKIDNSHLKFNISNYATTYDLNNAIQSRCVAPADIGTLTINGETWNPYSDGNKTITISGGGGLSWTDLASGSGHAIGSSSSRLDNLYGADANFSGTVTANKFQLTSGTGFLKANGTVDTNTYLTSSDAVLLTGNQSVGGEKTFTSKVIVSSSGIQMSDGTRIRVNSNHLTHYIDSTKNYNILDAEIAMNYCLGLQSYDSTPSGAIIIDTSVNVNNIKAAGTYCCKSAANITGQPARGNYRLWHIVNSGTDNNKNQSSVQIALFTNNAKMYMRNHTYSGTTETWGSWVEIATTGNVVTLDTEQTNISGAKTFTGGVTANALSISNGGTLSVIGSASTLEIKGESVNNKATTLAIQSDTTAKKNLTLCTGGGKVGICGAVDNTCDLKVAGTSLFSSNVGIGGYDSSYKLYVSGTAYVSELRIGSNIRLYPTGVASGADILDISAAGLRLNGNNITSDMRRKNVVSMVNDLTVENIARAPIFNFKWKQWPDGLTYVGTSAQYWDTVLPNAVLYLDDIYSLDYGATALAAAVMTARTVLTHESRIRLLEVENQALRKEIEQLKKVA